MSNVPYNINKMTILEKALWNISGNDIQINMSIQKVDKERRIVSGWATTDTLDKHGDVVDIAASEKAFEEFRGNVREMHTPLAVGKVVSFKKDTVFNKSTGAVSNGIFVDVYVSKGAEDTWMKVNEGVLTGFSIGGVVTEKESVYNKDTDGPITIIKAYRLNELSLVDNPANDESNFVSIQKLGDEVLTKNYLENIFWCSPDDPIIVTEKASYECPSCSKKMTNIGFVESNDSEKGTVVKSIVLGHENNEKAIVLVKEIAENKEEGETVEETTNQEVAVEKAEESVEAIVENTVEKAAETTETVETATTVEETVAKSEETTTPGNDDLAKAVTELGTLVTSAVSDLANIVKGLSQDIENIKKSNADQLAEVKASVSEFGKRVDVVENDTAIRKSGDLGKIDVEQKIEKSIWAGRFLSANLDRQAR